MEFPGQFSAEINSEELSVLEIDLLARIRAALRLDFKIVMTLAQSLYNPRNRLFCLSRQGFVVQSESVRARRERTPSFRFAVGNLLAHCKDASAARNNGQGINGRVRLYFQVRLKALPDVRYLRRPTDQNDLGN